MIHGLTPASDHVLNKPAIKTKERNTNKKVITLFTPFLYYPLSNELILQCNYNQEL